MERQSGPSVRGGGQFRHRTYTVARQYGVPVTVQGTRIIRRRPLSSSFADLALPSPSVVTSGARFFSPIVPRDLFDRVNERTSEILRDGRTTTKRRPPKRLVRRRRRCPPSSEPSAWMRDMALARYSSILGGTFPTRCPRCIRFRSHGFPPYEGERAGTLIDLTPFCFVFDRIGNTLADRNTYARRFGPASRCRLL